MAKKIEFTGKEDPILACRELEAGNILFFEKPPFSFPEEEIEFLLQQKQKGTKARKNISYKPDKDLMSNHDSSDPEVEKKLKSALQNYSGRATEFLKGFLAPYAKEWKVDYTSFRPFQEKGRNLRVRARNDLLHVDAFPTRPLHGDRILRFFTNINPNESRHWITGDPFIDLVKKFGGSEISFPKSVSYSLKSRLQRKMGQFIRASGVKVPIRSPYDDFMLRFHNFLKENSSFQENVEKEHFHFPPLSCWAVFTDQVSHAALSGQYALEQTFLVPVKTLLFPEKSPLRVLERLSGTNLVLPAKSR